MLNLPDYFTVRNGCITPESFCEAAIAGLRWQLPDSATQSLRPYGAGPKKVPGPVPQIRFLRHSNGAGPGKNNGPAP